MPPKSEKPKKAKFSRWLITVNPHRKPGTYPGGEAGIRRNLELCARLLTEPHIKKFIYFTPKGHAYDTHMLSATEEHAIEKGAKHGFVHMHLLLSCKHHSNIRLSYPVFKQACDKILGGKCHFDAKIARGGESLDDIRAYIHKGGAAKAAAAEETEEA